MLQPSSSALRVDEGCIKQENSEWWKKLGIRAQQSATFRDPPNRDGFMCFNSFSQCNAYYIIYNYKTNYSNDILYDLYVIIIRYYFVYFHIRSYLIMLGSGDLGISCFRPGKGNPSAYMASLVSHGHIWNWNTQIWQARKHTVITKSLSVNSHWFPQQFKPQCV